MRVLYTGFKGKNNSSYQLLAKISGQKLFLANSFDGLKKDIMNVVEEYDLVVMFGLDTRLKDAVRIEKVAEWENEKIITQLDCDEIHTNMVSCGICCAVSNIPTRYLCNAAYFHMLQKFSGKVVFIHIPPLKNMSESMVCKILESLEKIERNCKYV
ncbi:MAG: hypothetical protein IJW63_01685 [Lachnospiraceae bacterium]|nr:hypothetical protein [Lachnospiraceae bacterium]